MVPSSIRLDASDGSLNDCHVRSSRRQLTETRIFGFADGVMDGGGKEQACHTVATANLLHTNVTQAYR